MRIYTVHLRPGRAPVLVREGFAWGALVFGPLWLFAHRAWAAGLLALAADVLLAVLLPRSFAVPADLVLAWAYGLFGQDLRRLALAARDFLLVHIVAAPDADAAYAQLLARRPDLVPLAAA